mmetsp:Transcript_29460/g.43495  ORF Transcript_29460/g.43495 Transcript_29460/m.43495 type:complete len:514 (-) Transcript_29460:1659-3200(-)|eukprot:CAMPEP_0194201070 /NCGR_PEP_ID=MMETSP0156-20130528/1441_1 /TAXON_ID=33649 /ORGANISM="Thalassionema nitzschioides, Strain L26-B" /LENGTH=513 /DNA_ID=CAMNT_0038926175 /DNA_START=44 /DNA_END=1585 /DNA_ORIENTATION=-
MAEKEKGKEESKQVQTKNDDKSPSPPPKPPLEAAARRLDRLLGGDRKTLHSYTNPAKVIRRWLGTASGAAADATLDTIASAGAILLDPAGACAEGKALLTAGNTGAMDVEGAEPKFLSSSSEREIEIWLLSLVVRVYWKEKKLEEAFVLAQKTIAIVSKHIYIASANIANASRPTTSSLFPLLARMYRYRSLVSESKPGVALALHSDMIKAHGVASLRRDVDSQATLLNLMLHDLLNASQVEQAQKLLVNSTFPDSASNNQLCRYLYHSGRIQALRLEYTSAFSNLSQCLRKAPTNTGLGFRIAAQRLLVVVQLLMGEIPDRHVFLTTSMAAELAPYMAITQAVRRGDLSVFTAAVSKHAARLQEDGTYTLISRLAHQVVKAGLRKLHISYSRISLQDVADRLGLPSATSAEFVVAKAVRDGVLEATIHHEEGYVQSHDLVDVYATQEPAQAFHRRIAYCLTTHNDAVRGMRYPPDAYKKQLEASRGNRENAGDDKTDEEKAQELEDELDEEY